ncbi:HAMP domain-containing histidine kinase [bacterium]|nr:HAMP domain-containing histidine kinase [bacterium]
MFKKHFKIVEQISIVFIFAVIIPMTISGFIINNVNQHAIRYQLRESAILIANMVSEQIDFFDNTIKRELDQTAFALKYINNEKSKKDFLNSVKNNISNCVDLSIKEESEIEGLTVRNRENKVATVPFKLSDGKYLVASYKIEALRQELFKSLPAEERQIYILSGNGNLIADLNYSEKDYENVMALLPKKLKKNTPQIFGNVKNQPLVYFSKDNPNITIIVNTTAKITQGTIAESRMRIILSFLFAIFAIIFVVGLYVYYLYINIRQLFKAIIAVSKGNYGHRIRLLTTAFTPHEIIFLAFEFNRMAKEIHKSYIQLQKNNVELKQLNEFRSNLIDTVSHELRTPLTSIQGYTSRLMRQDIVIDEETKQKSLKIIKEQSERLKRLIEDLLTIPDIEGMRLRLDIEDVYIPEILDQAKVLIRNKENKEIVLNIKENFPIIQADRYRMLQIFVNLLENAVKYSTPDTKIVVDTEYDENRVKLYFKNDCEVIAPKKLKKLFEKFIRLDVDTTRTTRGTGLGLFIVKGLVENMDGKIKLHSDENCGFCVELEFFNVK